MSAADELLGDGHLAVVERELETARAAARALWDALVAALEGGEDDGYCFAWAEGDADSPCGSRACASRLEAERDALRLARDAGAKRETLEALGVVP